MKVYIVVPYYDFDGWGEPEAAFSSRLAAEAYAASFSNTTTIREVLEFEIDAAKKAAA